MNSGHKGKPPSSSKEDSELSSDYFVGEFDLPELDLGPSEQDYLVCECHCVPRNEIMDFIEQSKIDGLNKKETFNGLQCILHVGTGCGKCLNLVQNLLNKSS